MDSPSGRQPGEFHWASTLWHEMSHVFILTATNHRVPRWFTEGLAVHEETEASPEWGDRMTPDIVVAIRDKKLLPVADLDRGFIRPEYPDASDRVLLSGGPHLRLHQEPLGRGQAAGHGALVRRAQDHAGRDPAESGMTPEEFDKQFLALAGQGRGQDGREFRRVAQAA